MKKLLLVSLLAASLGGCAQLKAVGTAISLGTTSITNPVTKDRLNQMEAAITIVFTGLEAWRKSCEQGLIPASCKGQINAVQVYTRQIPPYLTQLRSFVKNNDQVNAVAVFNQIVTLADTIKSQAAAGGVTITAQVGS